MIKNRFQIGSGFFVGEADCHGPLGHAMTDVAITRSSNFRKNVVIPSEASAESRDLRIIDLFGRKLVRRSFDFAALCTASLRMTSLYLKAKK